MRHICKLENLKSERLSSTSCKKVIPPKEIHEHFMKTLGKESPSYSTVSLRGEERALWMMDGLAAPKIPPLMKMPRSCTPWLCVIVGETCEA